MSGASACGTQDHQALTHDLRAGVHDQDVHPVRQAGRLAAYIPREAVHREGGEISHPQPREVVQRDRARNRVTKSLNAGLLAPVTLIVSSCTPSTGHAVTTNWSAALAPMRSRWPVGEVVPGMTVRAAGTWLSAACTSSLPAPHDSLGDPLITAEPVPYAVAVKPSWRAVPVRTVRTCSGVRSDRRSSSRATEPVTIGVDIDVPLNSTCTPSVATSALGAGGVLVLEYTEKTPLPGAESSGFCRDGRLARTGRVGPEDENVARSPTCSRTTNWKRPPCAGRLTRFTWAGA